jgi:hypothetical protein
LWLLLMMMSRRGRRRLCMTTPSIDPPGRDERVGWGWRIWSRGRTG